MQQLEKDADRRRRQRKREQKKIDSIADSRALFLKRTRGLNHTHPTYKEEKRKHDIRVGNIRRMYG